MEGYYDDYTYEEWKDSAPTVTKIVGLRRNELEKTSDDKYIYQFMMTPNAGFLNENKVILNSLTKKSKVHHSLYRPTQNLHFHLIDYQRITRQF